MMGMHLVMCLVPPADEYVPMAFCRLGMKNATDDGIGEVTQATTVNTSLSLGRGNGTSVLARLTTLKVDLDKLSSTTTDSSIAKESSATEKKEGSNKEDLKSTEHTSSTSSTTTSVTTTTSTSTKSTSTKTTTTTEKGGGNLDTRKPIEKIGKGSDEQELTQEDKDLLKLLNISPDDLNNLSEADLEKLIQDRILSGDSKAAHRRRRSIIESVKNKWEQLSDRFDLAEYQTFVFILLLVIVGELFAAPYEKLADDCWFEYLDILDGLERYGGHRIWRTVGYVVVPTMVAAIVDHTPCVLPLGVNHFLLHFLAFAIFTAIAFLLALCYPVSQYKQTAKKSRLGKGVRVLCGGRHAFSMAFTMVVVGASTAVITNFLFWQVQDLSGPELAMGVSVAAAAGAEFVVRLVGFSLVKRLTPVGAVVLALLLLTGLLVFYSFLWSPWLIVAGEVFHGISITLLWMALRSYPDFRINPFVMDRSASSLVNSLHIGVGFATGSMVSGIIYDKLGYMLLFQGAAGLTGLWAILFLLLQKVGKKKEKVRYAKLLQDENIDDSDESTVYEDDWLEVAMKRDR